MVSLALVLKVLAVVYALGAVGFIPIGVNAIRSVKPRMDSDLELRVSQVFSFVIIVVGWPVWFAQGVILSRKH